MRLPLFTVCFAVFAASSLSSCMTKEEKAIRKMLNYPSNKIAGKPTGRIVSSKAAGDCFRAYDSLMKLHGFADTPNNTALTVSQTLKITRREAFRGKELMDFLVKAAFRHEQNEPDDGNENTSVQITLGIYTSNYLNYLNTQFQIPFDSARLNRIAVFLVTCSWDGQKWVPDPADDPSAFDFGGLQP